MEHLCYGLSGRGPSQAHVLSIGPPTVGTALGSCWNLKKWDLTGECRWVVGLKVSLNSTLLPVSLISSHCGFPTWTIYLCRLWDKTTLSCSNCYFRHFIMQWEVTNKMQLIHLLGYACYPSHREGWPYGPIILFPININLAYSNRGETNLSCD